MTGIGRAIGDESGSGDVRVLEMHGRISSDTGVEIRAGGPSRLRGDGVHMNARDVASFERARDPNRYQRALERTLGGSA